MIFETKTGTQSITKEQVWAAWKHVRSGGKGIGIDLVSVEMINANPRKYLYPLWNRLSSGSYFPPAVREMAIPKGKSDKRYLGIPTILDRVAQQVVRTELEAIVEPKFYKKFIRFTSGQKCAPGFGAMCQTLLGTMVCLKRRYQRILRQS